MQSKKIKQLLDFVPLLLLYVLAVILVCSIITLGYSFQWKHYVAFALLIATTTLFFKHHQLGVLMVGFTMLAGLIGLLSFDAAISTITIGLGKIKFPIFYGQPIFFLWLTVHFVFSGRYYIGVLSKQYWTVLKSQIINPKS